MLEEAISALRKNWALAILAPSGDYAHGERHLVFSRPVLLLIPDAAPQRSDRAAPPPTLPPPRLTPPKSTLPNPPTKLQEARAVRD